MKNRWNRPNEYRHKKPRPAMTASRENVTFYILLLAIFISDAR